jgi:hypothetical protein
VHLASLLALACAGCGESETAGAVPQRYLRNETYDVVIIGAGASGCVVAERLSRRPELRVLVLEAGLATTSEDGLRNGRTNDWLQLEADGLLRSANPPTSRLPSAWVGVGTQGARLLSRW